MLAALLFKLNGQESMNTDNHAARESVMLFHIFYITNKSNTSGSSN